MANEQQQQQQQQQQHHHHHHRSTSHQQPNLDRLQGPSQHEFQVPVKRINDGEDLSFFFASTAYRDLIKWLLQLNRSMFPRRDASGVDQPCVVDDVLDFPPSVKRVRSFLEDLSRLIDQVPPHTGPRRFGNVAFRDWSRLAQEHAPSLLQTHLGESLQDLSDAGLELVPYVLGGFGSAQRLDYGTGHELSFLAFVGCLWRLGLFDLGDERAIVIGIIQPYLELVRKLITTYTLEPAGSHGVWGLDDHSFLPYIFGSAQLGPAIPRNDYTVPIPTEGSLPGAPSPSSVTSKPLVTNYSRSNMYFAAVQFIYDVKKGPFWEHSPVLYDVSGIKDGWGKINKGMLKMYAAEVLGKFPVVQHFPFGSLFPWEKDPVAENIPSSLHAQHQPPARSGIVPPSGSTDTSSTSRPGNSIPQMQASTGMPSTRAPWTSHTGSRKLPTTSASLHRGQSEADMAPTVAPWARPGSGV